MAATKVSKGKVLINGINVFYRSVGESGIKTNRGNVLLLHGMRFSSANWEEINTLTNLASWNYYAVAVDLPGYGNSKDCKERPSNTAQFIHELCKCLKLEKPVVISPSMSGQYSLPYLHEFANNLRAYIPIAPIETGKFTSKQYQAINVPTFIVYGENDAVMGEQSLQNLSQIPGNKVTKMENAGHACYLDQTDKWHDILKTILDSI